MTFDGASGGALLHEGLDYRNARDIVLDLGHELGKGAADPAPHLPDLRYVAKDQKGRGNDRGEGDEGEIGIEDEEHHHHRRWNDQRQHGFGDAVGDEVLDGFDIVDGAGDEVASALPVEEAVGQALDMVVSAGHQLVHDAVGSYVRVASVAVAGETASEVDDQQQSGEFEQAGIAAAALGEPLDQTADNQRR